MRQDTLGGLKVRISGGDDGDGGGDGPVVVLLHGFGAPGDDLVPLAGTIDAPAGTRFVFPAAPLELPGFFGDARAWFMIDIEDRIRRMAMGGLDQLTRDVPDGLAAANDKVNALLDDVERQLGADPARLVLGGFSQGAMVALDVALRSERPLAGLGLMSATLICAEEWVPLMASRKQLPALLSHGRGDPILPFVVAERLRDLLRSAGLEVAWVDFAGGHEIPPQVLGGLGAVIAGAVA